MDAIVYGALEEICSQGVKGLTLHGLWSKIHPHLSSNGLNLCTNVKKALWSNVLNIPSIRFECKGVSYDAEHPKIQSVEDAESIDLRIVAAEHLLDSFVGIYDIKASDSSISELQRGVLDRLAIARRDGVTQNDLAKEFGKENKDMYYEVKKLESRGLIVRQSTIVRNEGEYKPGSVVNTNMVHLYRYAMHLGSLQRLEITKSKPFTHNENGVCEEHNKEDVHIRDYLPDLKAICDRLEKADGKVLVVSDIKRELGYLKTGHKAWRNMLQRLKDAHLVEEFNASVNKKEVSCLRLVKKFSLETRVSKCHGGVKRGQISDQLLELHIEQQVYDMNHMIYAQGSKRLNTKEVCKRLGINYKGYYRCVGDTVSRFWTNVASENHNTGKAYRPCSKEDTMNEKVSTGAQAGQLIQESDHAEANEEDNITPIPSPSINCNVDSTSSHNLQCPEIVCVKPAYTCLGLNSVSSEREQQILEKLEEEKVLLQPELHRLIENHEKKHTTMDRKTLERSLNKLQKDGHCKIISFSFPCVTNCGRWRKIKVILHPSVYESQQLSERIHARIRSFEKLSCDPQRNTGKFKSIPVLNNVERLNVKKDLQSETSEAMKNNGFVMSKMVRAKLLHVFLWGYVTRSPGRKLLELDAVIKAMPLELFLQVVGSPYELDSMVEKCKNGLCLSDLPPEEYSCLKDTRAPARLSSLIEFLTHLKLIRLIGVEGPHTTTTLRHSLELKPYIEEAQPVTGVDVRHDFVLATRKDVDEYWNTLEYGYVDKSKAKDQEATRVLITYKRKRKRKRCSKDHNENPLNQEDNGTHKLVDTQKVEDEENHSYSGIRRKRFVWSEKTDRLLVIEYVKHRAVLGAKYHRAEWASLQTLLPAPPDTCRRRMSILKRNNHLNNSLMELCNFLSLRYANHLQNSNNDDQEKWDDFDNKHIKILLDEVLKYKQVAKDARYISKYPPSHVSELKNDIGKGFATDSCKSLPVSNAIELLKLIFLSTAKASNFLAETLRRYSQRDLFTAFDYLRQRKFMVRGNDISRFVLSKQFLHDICSSPFPVNTGKRAVNMGKWVHEREDELLENGVNLPADLECGDVLQLCVLMCSGEVSVYPCLPDEGVGDTEELKKRKCDDERVEEVKKPKLLDSETFSRREKGFPDINLSLNRSLISRFTLSGDESKTRKNFSSGFNLDQNLSVSGESTWEAMTCYAKHIGQQEVSSSSLSSSPFSPNLFKTVYSAIQKAGDQGLNIQEISQMIDVQEEKIPELIIEVLETFGRALKVNAYDSIHVVDYVYRSKYLLTSRPQHLHPETCFKDGQEKGKKIMEEISLEVAEIQKENSTSSNHRVTILNRPEVEFSPCCKPILPWVNGDGSINEIVYKGLVRRVLGIIMQNPGILEEHIIAQMNVLNPQSCKKLLEIMILDSHITVRKMYESVSSGPPAMLRGLFGCSFKKPQLVCSKEHLFINPRSINLL